MNQILITEKLYVTPELKKKKNLYRVEFFISIFLVCLLFSYYIYAEYDKSKSEEVSKTILANTNIEEKVPDTTTQNKSEVLVAVLSETVEEPEQQPAEVNNGVSKETGNAEEKEKRYYTKTGLEYTTVAVVKVPKLGIEYAVISNPEGDISEPVMEGLLKESTCRFWGALRDTGIYDANEIGNFCIVGHNYRNKKFFSKVPNLENGDIIEITDMTGRTLKYAVYSKYIVAPDDNTCTSQKTNGKKEVTLITCTNDSKDRWIIKATEVL